MDTEEKKEMLTHYANILKAHYGWPTCYIAHDAKLIRYCEKPGEPFKNMYFKNVIRQGQEIENG